MTTDFEKLVVARKYIEALKHENGLLKDEVERQHKALKATKRAVQEEIDRKEKMTPEQKLKIKSDLYVQQQKDTINNLKAKLKITTDENTKLVRQLIKLNSGLT